MRIRTNCSREECIGAFVQAESELDPRGKRAWHGWPLRFRVLRGFHKYFVTFLLRDRIGQYRDGEKQHRRRRRLEIGVSIANLRALECLEFLMGGNAHIKKLLRAVDGCDHTSTNAPDPIRTPQLSVLGRE